MTFALVDADQPAPLLREVRMLQRYTEVPDTLRRASRLLSPACRHDDGSPAEGERLGDSATGEGAFVTRDRRLRIDSAVDRRGCPRRGCFGTCHLRESVRLANAGIRGRGTP